MGLENKVNNYLNQYPQVKKIIKRGYQVLRYSLSKKIKCEGNVIRVSPNDDYEYFFGYYDKSPWDINDRYILCLRAKCTYKKVAPEEPVDIIMIDTFNENKVIELATSHSWNVQQGCMLQWLGPNFDKQIIFNDFRNDKYCAVILDVFSKDEKIIDFPIYSVSNDGKFALSLDFSRLHTLRPGYGYSNIADKTSNELLPDSTCIWKVDLEKNEVSPLFKYIDFYNFEHRDEMKGAKHKVNHIMLSPNSKRFMVLHRWYQKQHKYSRLITCNCDGTDMYNLSDDDMVSHCYWKNDEEIISFENKKETGPGYYLMKDKSHEYTHLWKNIDNDGHPSYSPNKRYILIDSYPNNQRIQILKCMEENGKEKILARLFSPFKYDNDLRCDLHPRWNRKSNKVCFDSTFEGKRRLYIVESENDYV